MKLNGLNVDKKDPIASKLGSELALLYKEYTSSQLNLFSKVGNSQSRNSIMRVIDDRVVVDFIAAEDVDTLLANLQNLGLKQSSVNGRYVSGMLPIAAIGSAAALDNLKVGRPAMMMTNVGLVTSEADISMRADVARSTFGVDGSGVTVGVLSDSFDNLGGAGGDVASGDLPGTGNPFGNTTPVNVLEDIPSGGSDEGRAMLQLIHDVAPGADLAYHTAFLGQANFANGIIELAEAGSDVIVDDIIYFAEPMFQDGIIAQAVDRVVTDGVSYFSSAGNFARDSYESGFNPSGVVATGIGEFHDFDPGEGVDFLQSITVPVGAQLIISFQWDSPFFSVSGGAGSPNDLDILLFDESGTNVLASSVVANIGNDPVEVFGFVNNGSFGTDQFNLAISNFAGPNPDLLKYILFEGGGVTINEFATNSSTTYGKANAAGAEAVGAAFYQETPEFGVNPPELEFFSSAGGTPILFDTDGNRLAEAQIRQKPEIVAPDGTNTTFFGSTDIEGDGFPNFFGTSAAAPHVAAVAALMLEAAPGTSPDVIYETLEQTALDMDDPFTSGFDIGFDNGSGFGLIQADAAIEQLISSTNYEPNDTIPEAIATNLSSANPASFSFFNEIGDNPNVSPSADVDFYELELDAGDRIIIDIDADELGSTLDPILRLFDSAGNELALSDDNPAPGELASLDSFIDFLALETDNYYVGVSSFANSNYDPFIVGSGSGSGLSSGTYDIDITVSPDEAIVGTDDRDSLFGTVDDDIMFGKGGNDEIFAREGNNTVDAGDGDDTVYTGSGDDTITGGSGNDTVYAAEGNNTVDAGDGNDLIYTLSGSDFIDGGLGNDTIFAADGDDTVFGGVGDDTIYTGSGDNNISGNFGNDTIWLGGGQNIVSLGRFQGVDTIKNFHLGQTTFNVLGNPNHLSIVDGVNGAEISQFGELLAIVSFTSADTLIDNMDTVFI